MLAYSGKGRVLLILFILSALFYLYYRRDLPLAAFHGKGGSDVDTFWQDELSRSHVSATKPAVIAAGQNKTDLTWMSSVTDRYDLFPFRVDLPNQPKHLQIPANKGHEAMVYLSWIINHYQNLPPYAVFVHGHLHSWHQHADLVRLLYTLRPLALKRAGYVSLRCDWYPSCPAEIRPKAHDAAVWGPGVHRQDAEDAISRDWQLLFPNETLPDTIASPCCAQFAATKEAILKRPLSDYERIRQWLLDTELVDDISGRVLEKLWAYILTKDAVHCPAPQSCSCRYFGDCGTREWPEPPPELKKFSPDWGEPLT